MPLTESSTTGPIRRRNVPGFSPKRSAS